MEVPVMNNEELILQRLDRLEATLAPMSETFKSAMELKEDLTPLINRGFKVLIEELQDVETAFQLEDLFRLLKQGMRSIRNFSWSLEQLESLIDLLKTLEPLLKSTVPQLIHYLDDMEQKGVFRTYGAMLSVREKVAKQYSAEDFELMSDAFTSLLGLLRKLANPEVQTLLQRMVEIPACLELGTCRSVGPVGLVKAAYSDDVKQGLGVLIELTKALGKLKG
jgi:uncharacterized protein YjgD (DUF1641 family)